jgi:negative regulator of flagellin synthesis FlgM
MRLPWLAKGKCSCAPPVLLKFFTMLPIKQLPIKGHQDIDMTIQSITGRAFTPNPIKTPIKAEADGEKKPSVKGAERDDSVAITAMAQDLKKALASSSVALVDADRVASVKKALADGSYQINAERVAEKMIQFEKLMPQDKGLT